MTPDDVVLVDRNDRPCGLAGTGAAHQSPGLLHRGFSVVLWTPGEEIILRRRARAWSATCAGHPRPGESVTDAARRLVFAEFGAVPSELVAADRFLHTARDPLSGMVEREVHYVLTGRLDDCHAAREDLELVDLATLEGWFITEPRSFTPGFGEIIDLAVVRSASRADRPARGPESAARPPAAA